MLYQIVCLSCGYHRAWPTLVDAHADGHRHHAEHTAPCATPPCRRNRNRIPAGTGATNARNRVLVDLGPLGASAATGAHCPRLHLAFRVGAAGAETPVNLARCTARTPGGHRPWIKTSSVV